MKKRSIVTLYSVYFIILVIAFSPSTTHAGAISDFAGKVKSIFAKSDEVTEAVDLGSSQTMSLFKPTIIDDSTTIDAESDSQDLDVMQATEGSLRVSTEDIDFPVSDAISIYEVKKGDSLATVAKLFSVSKNTIIWANNLKSQNISPGDTLVILPMTGIKHTVKKGDTLASVAKKYKADTDDISKFNGITSDSLLTVGDVILVPDGEIAVSNQPAKSKYTKGASKLYKSYSSVAPSGFLIRPIVGGRKSQGLHGNNGVDLASTPGTPVMAAASGRVIIARTGGWNGGYGNMIIIAHDNGIQTVYAHLRVVHVTSGQTVNQGEQIGELGNTGRSTGPHLHFEVRGARNPF